MGATGMFSFEGAELPCAVVADGTIDPFDASPSSCAEIIDIDGTLTSRTEMASLVAQGCCQGTQSVCHDFDMPAGTSKKSKGTRGKKKSGTRRSQKSGKSSN